LFHVTFAVTFQFEYITNVRQVKQEVFAIVSCAFSNLAFDLATVGTAGVTVFNPRPGGTSNPVVFTVEQATTTLALTSAPNPSTSGSSISFTATLTQFAASAPGRAPRSLRDVTPTGIVTFTLDGTTNVTPPIDTSGSAAYTTNALTLGAHTVVAGITLL